MRNEGCNERENCETSEEREGIRESGSLAIKSGRHALYCLTVIGQIEGHYALAPQEKATKYEHIIPLVVSVEDNDDTDGLLMILNTVGGDVEAGLAIAELVASMRKPTASLVLGGGHSIGVPLAVSARRSFIVPSATMTLHPVRISGTFIGAPQSFVNLNRIQERVTGFVASHSGMSAARYGELILGRDELASDLGTVLDGQTAVNEHLIDEVGGLSAAIGWLKREIGR